MWALRLLEGWPADKAFPLLDVARALVLHPKVERR